MVLRSAEQLAEEVARWVLRWVEQRTKLEAMDPTENHFLAGRRTGQLAAFEEVVAYLTGREVHQVHDDLKRMWAQRGDELQARRERRGLPPFDS